MNVVKIPTKYKPPPLPRQDSPDVSRLKTSIPWGIVRAILACAWMIVRVSVFLVLYWLRLPVVFVCNLISVPTLLLFLFSWYAFPDKTHMVVGFGVISFIAFAVQYLYDMILMWLAPQEMMRTL